MNDLRHRLEEDRALRNAARKLFRKELDHVRQEIAPQALGERIADRIGGKVDAASDEAVEFAQRHGGAIAATGGAIVTAVGLWLARKPILKRLIDGSGEPDGATGDNTDEETDDD